MYEFGEKHPIGFEIILIIVSFLAAGVIVMACSIVNLHADLSSSIARIFVALVLLVIYRRAFCGACAARDLQEGVYWAKSLHKSCDPDSVAVVCCMERFLQPQFGDGLRRKRVLH